ncbi:hypothetical protein AMTRI_Chr06g173860 [Amborella trichopoda]|uniref:uncharacterized protein LOC18440048 isoform X1 n=1 Tax=Amborella trichopoda TaxID=13333 RepID=UPI0009C0BFFF|nr:uncharacterized protein LOC18440048 isoform X1 [Amborella trichopoda]|eukprot:XP_020526569.1 uncharacterized protein LOC18440048 isoform X1 [Amborella trichopoda]
MADREWSLRKKIVLTGLALSSAPVVLPPLMFFSAVGFVFAVPFGVAFIGYACTAKVLNSLLRRKQEKAPLMAIKGEVESDKKVWEDTIRPGKRIKWEDMHLEEIHDAEENYEDERESPVSGKEEDGKRIEEKCEEREGLEGERRKEREVKSEKKPVSAEGARKGEGKFSQEQGGELKDYSTEKKKDESEDLEEMSDGERVPVKGEREALGKLSEEQSVELKESNKGEKYERADPEQLRPSEGAAATVKGREKEDGGESTEEEGSSKMEDYTEERNKYVMIVSEKQAPEPDEPKKKLDEAHGIKEGPATFTLQPVHGENKDHTTIVSEEPSAPMLQKNGHGDVTEPCPDIYCYSALPYPSESKETAEVGNPQSTRVFENGHGSLREPSRGVLDYSSLPESPKQKVIVSEMGSLTDYTSTMGDISALTTNELISTTGDLSVDTMNKRGDDTVDFPIKSQSVVHTESIPGGKPVSEEKAIASEMVSLTDDYTSVMGSISALTTNEYISTIGDLSVDSMNKRGDGTADFPVKSDGHTESILGGKLVSEEQKEIASEMVSLTDDCTSTMDDISTLTTKKYISTTGDPSIDTINRRGDDTGGFPVEFQSYQSGAHTESIPGRKPKSESIPGGKPVSEEDLYNEEVIWEQIEAMRAIVGYKGVIHASCLEELKALYVFTGVEPLASFKDTPDLMELNDKLRFLKSVVGVK